MVSKEEKKLKWLRKPLTEKEKIAILKKNKKKKGFLGE
jgi:hypothetical protein